MKNEVKEFINKYQALIGHHVVDEHFNAPLTSSKNFNGLTKVKLLNKIVELFYRNSFKIAISNNDKVKLLNLTNEILSIAYDLGFKTGKKWLNNAILPYSIGNNKIGSDTLVFNCSPALLCPADLKGYCENCNSCYAKNNELLYGTPFIRNLLAFKKLLTIDIDTIIMETLEAIKTDNTIKDGAKAKNAIFIRINSNGDILDNVMLKAIDKFCLKLIESNTNNLKIAYSYTHNKDLNLKLSSHIVFNLSFKDESITTKRCVTAYSFNKKYLDNSKYIICNGKCKNCPYCKDVDEKRTIVFMAHGGHLKGLNMLPDGLIDVLNSHKAYDWAKFNSKLCNSKHLTFKDFL